MFRVIGRGYRWAHMNSNSSLPAADGLRVIRLGNAALALALLPEVGGKLVELRDRRTGRDWLWQNPHLAHAPPAYAASFGGVLDSGGWDEIVPSVSACSIELGDGSHRLLPDHGDAARLAWTVRALQVSEDHGGRCELEVSGRALPFRFSRAVELDAVQPRLICSYELQNTGAVGWPYLYCAHPLFDIRRGALIDLPAGQEMRIEALIGVPRLTHGEPCRWPTLPISATTTLNLAASLDAAADSLPFAAKIFVRSPPDGCVSIVDSTSSARLTFRYDPASMPWLGLWINNGGWSGSGSAPYRNLAVEPSTAGTDSLAEAVATGEALTLAPGESHQWSIVVELRS